MKRLVLFLLSLVFAAAATGQTAADKIAAGRAALSVQDPVTAQARFQEALALDPANQTAGALLGITQLFNIASLPGSTSFLDYLGVSAGGRSLYNWTATPAQDGNGNPVIPANYNLTSVTGYWQNTWVPASVAARGNFALVTDPNFLLTLSPAECGPNSPAPVNIDYGDVLMARACLSGMEFFMHFLQGQNMSLNIDDLRQLTQGNLDSLQRVLSDNPDLLKPGASSERTAARASLLDLIALYRQASAAIRARAPGLSRVFMLDPAKLTKEAYFRAGLDQLELSLGAPIQVGDPGKYRYVQAAPLFSGDWSLRAQFPTFSATGFDLTTIPDPTLGGVVSGLTREQVAKLFIDPPDTLPELGWTWVSPLPQGSTLYRYLPLPGGKHIVIGNAGAILTSTDGANWTAQRIAGGAAITGVATNGTTTVAVANSGRIYSSPDSGVTWQIAMRDGNSYNAVIYVNSQFVAVGDYGSIATSSDGQNWNSNYLGPYSLNDIIFNGSGLYVGVGFDLTVNRGAIFTSPDLVNWTKRFTASGSNFAYYSVARTGTKLVVVGQNPKCVVSSNSGINWTESASPVLSSTTNFSGVGYRAGLFVACGIDTSVGAGKLATSPDGVTWTGLNPGENLSLVRVGVNATTTYVVGQGGLILSSTDNATFTRAANLQSAVARNVILLGLRAIDGQLYVCGSGGAMARSSDGLTFTSVTSGTANDLWDIVKQGSTYCAVGNAGTIITSTDGVTWSAASSGTAAPLRNVVSLNGQFIATGNNGTLLTSPDGATWTSRPTSVPGVLYGVAYGNGTYVAVGGNNAGLSHILTSPDGNTWTIRSSPTLATFRAVVFNQGVFTAVGTDGTICRSSDGVSWGYVKSEVQTSIFGLRVFNGRYYATQTTSDSTGTITETQAAVLVSSNGQDWVRVPQGAVNTQYRPELFQGRIYTAGNLATILRTQPLPALAAPTVQVITAGQHSPLGGNVVLMVTTTGDGGLVFQWNKNGAPLPGANDPGLALSNLQSGDAASYTLTVTNAAGSVTTDPIALYVDANYPAWTALKFTANEQADPGRSGPNAVYGLDSLGNLVKYALGLEPKANITSNLPVVSATATDWVYTYTRPSNITDLTYSVEVSTNLTTWTTAGVTHEFVSTSGGVDTWHARYPLASGNTVYFRLKVIH